jgi:hypothetical protein
MEAINLMPSFASCKSCCDGVRLPGSTSGSPAAAGFHAICSQKFIAFWA